VCAELLGLISVAAFLGASLSASPNAQLLVDVHRALNEVFIAMILRIIAFTPLGVGSLVAGSIAAASDVAAVFRSLSSLMGVVYIAALCSHAAPPLAMLLCCSQLTGGAMVVPWRVR
jgi:Na+/H+-dicarboxylate symporter